MMKSYRQLLEERITRLAAELAEASAELAAYQTLRAAEATRLDPPAAQMPLAPTFEVPVAAPIAVAQVAAAPAVVAVAAPVAQVAVAPVIAAPAPVAVAPVALPRPVTVEEILAAPIANPQLLATIPAPRPAPQPAPVVVRAAVVAPAPVMAVVQEPELVEPDGFLEEATQAIQVVANQAAPAARRGTLEETRAVQHSIEQMFAEAEAILRPHDPLLPKIWYHRPTNIALIAASLLAVILTFKVALRDDPVPPAAGLGQPVPTMMGPANAAPVAPAGAPAPTAAPGRPSPSAPTSTAPDAGEKQELSEGSGALAQASDRVNNRRSRHSRRRH